MSHPHRLSAWVLCTASALQVGCALPSAQEPLAHVQVQALSDGVWVVAAIDGLTSVTATPPTLRWTENGRIVGSGGCNQFSGRYALEQDRLVLSALVATRMLCVPEPRGQEDKFFKALERTQRAQLVGGVLELQDEQGLALVRLVRASR